VTAKAAQSIRYPLSTTPHPGKLAVLHEPRVHLPFEFFDHTGAKKGIDFKEATSW
jgi:hypothetical protein